jgi:ATP/ADP translocase
MDRKEFLYYLFNNIIKPAFYLLILIVLIFMIKNAILNEDSTERLLIIISSIFIGVFVIFAFIIYLVDSIWKSIPERIKSFLNTVTKITSILIIPFIAYLIYINWNEKKINIISFGIVYLMIYLINKKQTKQTL